MTDIELTEKERVWLRRKKGIHVPKSTMNAGFIAGVCWGDKRGMGKKLHERANATMMPKESGFDLTVVKGKEHVWAKYKRINSADAYAVAVIYAAEVVGKHLDDGMMPEKALEGDSYGLSGFQAGCVAQIISEFHPRGEEFRRWWNLNHQLHDEGVRANESGGVLNPAVLRVEVK